MGTSAGFPAVLLLIDEGAWRPVIGWAFPLADAAAAQAVSTATASGSSALSVGRHLRRWRKPVGATTVCPSPAGRAPAFRPPLRSSILAGTTSRPKPRLEGFK